MKTKIEFGEYKVEIEELEGVLSVKALKDGEEDEEVVEEFELRLEEDGEAPEGLEDEEDVKSFGDFAQEEDFEGEEEAPEGLEDEVEAEDLEDLEEEDDETTLESFQSFINKRK